MSASKTTVRVLAVASAMFGLGASAFGQATFQSLGDLPGGRFSSQAAAISADGSVVVGSSNSAAGNEGFRWTSAGGMVALGFLPGGNFVSVATGTSADGAVVVGLSRSANTTTTRTEAFRWTSPGNMVGLGDLPGSIFASQAIGVSGDGAVVVGHGRSESGSEAFRWTAGGGMVGLGFLPGGSFGSSASATSVDGSVVVGESTSALGPQAFRWTSGGGMVGLGDLPGGQFLSFARAISADGAVVVGSSRSASGTEAFRWTSGGGMVGLGDLPTGTFNSTAMATSADGAVVVGRSFSALGIEAILWTAEDGMRPLRLLLATDFGLDVTRGQLNRATGISADGLTIVGDGFNAAGFLEGWIVTLLPFVDCNANGVPDDTEPDEDADGVTDDCDRCPDFDDAIDDDGDGVCDTADICPGFDDNVDTDGDGVPNGCDEDDDDDGILDEVDTSPFGQTQQFSDLPLGGSTFGEVVGPLVNGAMPEGVLISDAASPDGIRVEVAGEDVLDLIFFCANGVNVTSVGPSETVYTCGSLGIDSILGSATATFTIDGVAHDVVIDEGGSVRLEDTIGEFGVLLGMTIIADGANGTVTVDAEPLTPGQTAGVGDCGTLLVHANKHTVGSGSHPGSTKEPLVAIEVCVYDKSEGSCAAALGVSWRNYPDILASCEAVACGTTDANGELTIILPPGDYIVIAHWDDDNDPATADIILGVSASDLVCGQLMQKHLQVLVDANGNKRPGKTTRLTGSELLIIEPEYVLWDNTEQLYAFVLESVGDWGVTVSVAPPEGFVADFNELSQAVQFTITELGSDLVPTRTTFQVQHNGRRRTVRSEVGILLTPDYARSRGFDVAQLRARGLIRERPGGRR